MSGLEVVGIVAGIVSAYMGAATVYQSRRAQRRERREKKANEKLEEVVATSGPVIKEEYDQDFQRLGQVFARGDNIGQMALMGQLITLQQTVIALLSSSTGLANPLSAVIHPNHDQIFQISNSVRDNTLSALGEQFQRLVQAAPIRKVSQSHSGLDDERHAVSRGERCFIHVKIKKFSSLEMSCSSCGWTYSGTVLSGLMPWYCRGGSYHSGQCFHLKFHYKPPGRMTSLWRCFLCPGGLEFSTRKDVMDHLRMNHTFLEFYDDNCWRMSGCKHAWQPS